MSNFKINVDSEVIHEYVEERIKTLIKTYFAKELKNLAVYVTISKNDVTVKCLEINVVDIKYYSNEMDKLFSFLNDYNVLYNGGRIMIYLNKIDFLNNTNNVCKILESSKNVNKWNL